MLIYALPSVHTARTNRPSSVRSTRHIILGCDELTGTRPVDAILSFLASLKYSNGSFFLVPAYPGCPGQDAVKSGGCGKGVTLYRLTGCGSVTPEFFWTFCMPNRAS